MNQTVPLNGKLYIRPTYPYQEWMELNGNESVDYKVISKRDLMVIVDEDDCACHDKGFLGNAHYSSDVDNSENDGDGYCAEGCYDDGCYGDGSNDKENSRYKPFPDKARFFFHAVNNFQDYILQIADYGEAKYPFTVGTEGHTIQKFIETKVEKLRDFLHTSFRMFEECRILKQGSVYEGTKIGHPDEFDFMIEIPSVRKYDAVRIIPPSLNSDDFYCKIEDSLFFSDISAHPLARYNVIRDGLDKVSDLTLKLAFENTKIIKILLVHISRIFQNKFDELFPEECKYKSLHAQVEIQRAMTFTLLWRGEQFPWLPISVDFVIGIPLDDTIFSDKMFTHAIFFSHTPRISFSFLETSYLSRFPICGGKLKFLRLMKWFKEMFFSKDVSFNLTSSCLLRNQSVISTYWIKNIVFYIYQMYENETKNIACTNENNTKLSRKLFEEVTTNTITLSDGKTSDRQEVLPQDALIDGGVLPQDALTDVGALPQGSLTNVEILPQDPLTDEGVLPQDAFTDNELSYRIVETLEILLECCQKKTLYSFNFPEKNLISVDDDSDDQNEKLENLQIIERETRALLNAIRCMENDPNSLSQLRQQIRKTNDVTDGEMKQFLFRRTIKEILDYARSGYLVEGLERLQAFCTYLNDFHGTDFTIAGQGEDIRFAVDGIQVDIVGEVLKIHQTHNLKAST